ncbi:MAG: nucleotide exchange factor GrpE [Bacteroidota bacterium]
MIKEIDQLRDKLVKMATEQLQLKQELERQKDAYEARLKEAFLSIIKQLDDLQKEQQEKLVQAAEDPAHLAQINQLYEQLQAPLKKILQIHHIHRLQSPAEQLPEYSAVLDTVRDQSKMNGTLVHVRQLGYLWGDQLLRPAGLVVVKND